MSYIIYGLVDPRTNEIRYVGQTRNGMNRIRRHATVTMKAKTYCGCWLRELAKAGFTYTVVQLDEVDFPEELDTFERKWIADLRAQGVRLTNLTDGGGGCQNPSAETRARMRASHLGKKPSAETRAKLSKLHRGRKLSEAVKAKLAVIRAKRVYGPVPEEQKARQRAKLLGRVKSLEVRANMKASWDDELRRAAHADKMRQYWANMSADKREKMRENGRTAMLREDITEDRVCAALSNAFSLKEAATALGATRKVFARFPAQVAEFAARRSKERSAKRAVRNFGLGK